MISGLSLALNLAGYLAALAITLLSGFYTFRQRLTSYQLIRDFLVLVYLVVVFLMLVDLARLTAASPALLSAYPLLSFGLAFLESILLLTAAVGAYLRPNGSTYRLLFKDLRSHLAHLCMFVLFIGGTAAAELYLALFRPYTTVTAVDFAGGSVEAVVYSTAFSIGIGALFVLFLAYPIGLLVVGALRVRNPQMKRAQLGLAIGWAGSSAIYLISSLSLFSYALDVTAIAYVILSVFFGMIARNFRKAALFAGFVTPVAPQLAEPRQDWAPRTLSKDGQLVLFEEGELSLVEVETSDRYEEKMNSLVKDFLAERRGVFVISAKGSRLNAFFSAVPGVRLYTMSESTGYIAPSSTRTDEVNLPLYDSGVLLEVLDRTLASVGEPTAIIFDSVSDMMIYVGFQPCYKFLRAAAEIISGKKAIALFVLFTGAHDEMNVRAIRSIFPAQVRVGPEGFEVVR
ncbi:MAG TPA: hypothetical protein VND40_00140 [Nitrososphaerales archaeon]|nr:hypothetical protein [Nitrososphaerales archaeon]